MVSIKDYALQKGISYEAVRKQVDRYKDELQEHIVTQGKARYLDDVAVAFLDEKRAASPIIIMEQSKDEELQALRAERDELLHKLVAAQERLLADADHIAELTAEVYELKQLQAAPEPQAEEVKIPDKKSSFWERIRNAFS